MKRKTRGALGNVALFCCALFLILYLNGRSQSVTGQTFAWTTVRYRTRSTTLPQPRGVCPGLSECEKPALVVARVAADGDDKWLDVLADKYHVCVYTADAPVGSSAASASSSTHLRLPANRGHEAMAYLTFLIDNYHQIPATGAVFIHGSRWAWHNDSPDYDNAASLAALNVSAALSPLGYHNLRCDWSASTCPVSEDAGQGSLRTSINAVLEPWNQRVVSDAALPGALVALFGGDDGSIAGHGGADNAARVLLGRGDAVRAQCCAQFVVARDSIWQHSRGEYVALRQWLLDGSSSSSESGSGGDSGSRGSRQSRMQTHPNAAPPDDRIAGRIMSYLWHILFIQPDGSSPTPNSPESSTARAIDLAKLNSLACPSAEECYCRLYGRCGLEGCTGPGRCHGQYAVPPGFRLPSDWAETHS